MSEVVKLKDIEYNIAEIPPTWTPSEEEHNFVSLLGRLKKELCCYLLETQAIEVKQLSSSKYVQDNAGLYVRSSFMSGGLFIGEMTAEMIAECFRNRSKVPNAGWGGHNGFPDVIVNMQHAQMLASIFNKFAVDCGYADKITSYVCACFIAICATENGGIEFNTGPGTVSGGPFAVISINWPAFDKFCQSRPEYQHLSSNGLRNESPDLETAYVAGCWYFFILVHQVDDAINHDAVKIAKRHLGYGHEDKYWQKGVMYGKNQYFYGYIWGVAPGEYGFDKHHPNYVGHVETFNQIILGMTPSGIYAGPYNGPTVAPSLLQPVNPEMEVYPNQRSFLVGGSNYTWTPGSPPEHICAANIVPVNIKTRNQNNNMVIRRIFVHRALAAKFKAIFDEIYQNTNFQIISLGENGYSYRQATESIKLSRHSYGSAIDINGSQNPYPKIGRVNLRTPAARSGDNNIQIRSVYHPVVQIFAKYGFVWGARYNRGPDYMHFEWIGPPR